MRNISSYEKSLCFLEIWILRVKLAIWKKIIIILSRSTVCSWSAGLRPTPHRLLRSVVIANPTVGMRLQVYCFALIIIYVFSRNLNYNQYLKYWSNMLKKLKVLLCCLLGPKKKQKQLKGVVSMWVLFDHDFFFCLTSCYKHWTIVIDELCIYICHL